MKFEDNVQGFHELLAWHCSVFVLGRRAVPSGQLLIRDAGVCSKTFSTERESLMAVSWPKVPIMVWEQKALVACISTPKGPSIQIQSIFPKPLLPFLV